MATYRDIKEIETDLGDLVAVLYNEAAELKLSEEGKNALVAIMLSDILSKEGLEITFNSLPTLHHREAAA